MKKQHLIALALLVVLLFVARAVLKRHDREVVQHMEEAGVVKVIASELKAADVRYVSVQAPTPEAAKPAEEAKEAESTGAEQTATEEEPADETPAADSKPPLRVEKRDGNWVVASAHDAPAESTQVDEFVEGALAMAGELRGKGENSFAEFGVDAAHATKVEIGKEPGKPDAIVYIGKSGDSGDAHFVRVEGSDEIRHVTDGLRRGLGLWGENAAPAADHWVKKEILKLEEAKLTRVTVDRADMHAVFEKVEQTPPAPPPAAEGTTPPAPPAIKSWKVVEPVLNWPLREDAIAGVMTRVASVRVQGALDPSDPACAAAPVATVTLEQEGGAAPTVVTVLGKRTDKEEVALRVEGQPHCYSLASWGLNSLMPRASALWEVPVAFPSAPASTDVKSVTFQRGGQRARLTKGDGDEWKMDGKGKADGSRVSRMVGALVGLRFDDVALASRVPAAALQPTATITAEAAGKKLTVTVLGERAGTSTGERYVRVDGAGALPSGHVGVIPKYTADSLLPELKELGSSS
jgi:hypothetical protein